MFSTLSININEMHPVLRKMSFFLSYICNILYIHKNITKLEYKQHLSIKCIILD